MNFTIRKISNYGVSHPVVARLSVQTSELIKFSDLSKEDQQQVGALYMSTLQPRLLKCHDILKRLRQALRESVASVEEEQKQSQGRIMALPYVIGLEGEVESFLYETKNYLRDLLNLFRILFGFKEIKASQFCDVKGKGESQITVWSKKKFAEDDDLTKLLRSEQVWVEQCVRMRDAVEHPGGFSGTLTIHNVRPHPQGLIPPSWSRSGGAESDIFTDMETLMDNLLTIAEDLLVACIKKRLSFPNIEFYAIPADERNVEIPQRLRIGLAAELEAKLAEAAKPRNANAATEIRHKGG